MDDINDKPHPSYTGPQPIELPKRTKPPDYVGVSETPSGVNRVVNTLAEDFTKAKRLSRYKVYGAAGGLILTLLGGGKLVQAQGESQETKNVRVEDRQTKVEEKVAELKIRVDAGEKGQRKLERKVDRVEIMVELELKKHGIEAPPKSDESEE